MQKKRQEQEEEEQRKVCLELLHKAQVAKDKATKQEEYCNKLLASLEKQHEKVAAATKAKCNAKKKHDKMVQDLKLLRAELATANRTLNTLSKFLKWYFTFCVCPFFTFCVCPFLLFVFVLFCFSFLCLSFFTFCVCSFLLFVFVLFYFLCLYFLCLSFFTFCVCTFLFLLFVFVLFWVHFCFHNAINFFSRVAREERQAQHRRLR